MGRPTVAIINVVVSHDVFNSSYSDIFCRSPAFVCRGLLLPWCQWCTGRAGAGPRAPAATTNLPRTNLPPPAAAAAARTAAPRHGTRPRPPARHAAATRPELTCVGCSGSESAAARPSPGPAALSTAVCSLHRAQDTDRRHGERLQPRSHSQ